MVVLLVAQREFCAISILTMGERQEIDAVGCGRLMLKKTLYEFIVTLWEGQNPQL
jgi:hypothetical protein